MSYVRGLDGLRAVAVIAVVVFHAEFAVASGGFLGVSLFFTLSGFLITTLLLAEFDSSGTVALRQFYARRARRLLPAALACLALVIACSPWWAAGQQRNLPGDLLASVANVANWRFAFSSAEYQDLFLGDSSPVAHFWSLAIEEQIYLVLPLVVYVALRRGRRTLAVTTGVLLAGSVAATLLTSNRDLIYNATHTRAAELLVGVGLAQVMWRRVHSPRTSAHTRFGALPGALAGAGFVVLVMAASIGQAWIYDGGLLGVGLLSAVLIAAVVDGRFPASLLSAAPLVAIGKVSYGIYLYHWPVFALLDEQRTGLDQIPLFLVRCAVTGVLTLVSYRLIEQPIRDGRVLIARRRWVPMLAGAAAAVAVAAVVVVPTPGLTETEQLLAVGDAEVVEFFESGTDTSVHEASAPDTARATPIEPALQPSAPIATVEEPVELDEEPVVEEPDPLRVAVLGSEPATPAALRTERADDALVVVDDVREDCPLSRVEMPGCPRLMERWSSLRAGGQVDVVVLVTNSAELDDVRAQQAAAETVEQVAAIGVNDEAAIDEVLDVIDDALTAGIDVVWYTPAHPTTAYFRYFSRIGVERPEARMVVGGAVTLAEIMREVQTSRSVPVPEAESDERSLDLLVIGDSTSLNFARALHDGSEGEIRVLWAGANGCPLSIVEAMRGGSGAEWAIADCEPWSEKVPPLLASFDADAVLLMTGPMELNEHRFPGDPNAWVATDGAFLDARAAQLGALMGAIGSDLPVLIADLPAIAEGMFFGPEMNSPERLAAVNDQIAQWDQQFAQVARFPYRETLEAAEAARGAGRSIRSDGAHPDVEPLAELAREVYVDELLRAVEVVRGELALATPGGS